MSGGNFLVSLPEVASSENTLWCRSLLKGRINFWQEDLMKDGPKPDKFIEALICEDCDVDSLTLSPESIEVGYIIAGYIAKKIKKRLSCSTCNSNIISDSTDCSYFLHPSRGGLTCPSSCFSEFVCKDFALLDFQDSFIRQQNFISTREGALHTLRYFLDNFTIFCDRHLHQVKDSTLKMTINIFYNNKQKAMNDSIQKDSITTFKKRQREKQRTWKL